MQKCEKCAYIGDNVNGKKGCKVIFNNECDGSNQKCSFYKSRRQHIEDRDRAIDICRKKGLCNNCKYNPVPCRKSDENGGECNG